MRAEKIIMCKGIGVFTNGMIMSNGVGVVKNYEIRAKDILNAELKRRRVTYGQLADRLSFLGTLETEQSIADKISRGGFTAAFFLMCMDAIGSTSVDLER